MTNMERAVIWALGIITFLAIYMVILTVLFHVSPNKMGTLCSLGESSPTYTPTEREFCKKK